MIPGSQDPIQYPDEKAKASRGGGLDRSHDRRNLIIIFFIMKTETQEKADANMWLQRRLEHLDRHGASQQMINEAYGQSKSMIFEIEERWERIRNGTSKSVTEIIDR